MNQSKNKKRIQLHMPVSAEHLCTGEYMPIANVTNITPENALKRKAMKEQGQEARD